MRVFIALGSNLANPIQQLHLAIAKIAQLPQTSFVKVSKFYRNPPVGYLNQPDFVNAVVEVTSQLPAEQLLDHLLEIEKLQGRIRGRDRNGPRILDLDLLLYGDLVQSTAHLGIPHPRLKERSFVLYPLADLDSHLILPCNTPIRDLLKKIPDTNLKVVESEHIIFAEDVV